MDIKDFFTGMIKIKDKREIDSKLSMKGFISKKHI